MNDTLPKPVPVPELRSRRETANTLWAVAQDTGLTPSDLAIAMRISRGRARHWFEGLAPITAVEAEVVAAAFDRWKRAEACPIPGDPTFGELIERYAKAARLPRFC